MSIIQESEYITLMMLLEGAQGEDAPLLAAATTAARRRLVLALLGTAAEGVPTLATLDLLARCLDPCVAVKPTLDVVPLLPSLQTSLLPIQLTKLHPACTEIYSTETHQAAAQALIDTLNKKSRDNQDCNDAEALKLKIFHPLPLGPASSTSAPSPLATSHARVADQDWPADRDIRFATVACGGTFDRLHAGHRLLLAATAVVATQRIFVGVTADKLLANKKNAELLESYEVRERHAVEYMQHVNPHIEVTAGPLSDPKVPPLAATDPSFDAIVVSEETIHGAEQINAVRASLGFKPLVIVVVGLLSQAGAGAKLSSTDLRALDAAAAAAASKSARKL